MATKKQSAPGKGQKQKNPSIQVRIDRLNDYEGSNIKAFASANIGGAFAIPVSYTHLDVYKRQFGNGAVLAGR